MQYQAIPRNTMLYHATQYRLETMQLITKLFNIMQWHAIPCIIMQYLEVLCSSIHYHAIPCNTRQYHLVLSSFQMCSNVFTRVHTCSKPVQLCSTLSNCSNVIKYVEVGGAGCRKARSMKAGSNKAGSRGAVLVDMWWYWAVEASTSWYLVYWVSRRWFQVSIRQ